MPEEKENRFLEAAQDLRYLLGKGYPRHGALTFVGNRYQLPKMEREILGRGIYPGHEAWTRHNRLLGVEKIKGRAVGIDGHNVIITLESAILGRDLILCDDGAIRDAAWISGAYRPSKATDKAIKLVLDFLGRHGALSIVFFLYGAMSMSGEMAADIGAYLSAKNIIGRAKAVPLPREELAAFPGLVATSNSVLIDRVSEPIDLAGLILQGRKMKNEIITLGLDFSGRFVC